jgi:hypothetical protein
MELLDFVHTVFESLHFTARASLRVSVFTVTAKYHDRSHTSLSFMPFVAPTCVFGLRSKSHTQPQKVGVKVERCQRPAVVDRWGKTTLGAAYRASNCKYRRRRDGVKGLCLDNAIVRNGKGKVVSGYVIKACRGSRRIAPLF